MAYYTARGEKALEISRLIREADTVDPPENNRLSQAALTAFLVELRTNEDSSYQLSTHGGSYWTEAKVSKDGKDITLATTDKQTREKIIIEVKGEELVTFRERPSSSTSGRHKERIVNAGDVAELIYDLRDRLEQAHALMVAITRSTGRGV